MKKYLLSIILLLIISLSACTEDINKDVTFSVESGHTFKQYEGEAYVIGLKSVYAYDYTGKDISAFIEVKGTYDFDVPGTYDITLYASDDVGNSGEITAVLIIEEITCAMDSTQDKCVIHVESIKFNQLTENVTGLFMDDFVRIIVDITPLNAHNTTLFYSSSDDSIATITEYGFVFAHSPGEVTITVRSQDGNFTLSKTIEVWTKSCADDPLQDKCAIDILGDQSRIVELDSSNQSGTDYKTVYVRNKVYYQIYVRTFADSDGNFKGDFKGLEANLPYLKDLGIGGIWLMPINQSRSSHGYEVDDYYDVDNEYGSMQDFEDLLAAAALLDIDIIIDLVINHMGAYNPIFQDVLQNGIYSEYYNWFNWLDGSDYRVSWGGSWGQTIWYNPTGRDWLKDGNYTVHSSLSNKYFCAYFSDWMPDFNLENAEVRTYLKNVAKYWLDMGVAGFRMDATSHFYGVNEHFGLDNHSENVAFLTEYYDYILSVDSDAFVVVEAWEGYGTYASYTESGVSTINFESNYKMKDAVNGNYGYLAEDLNNVYNEYKKYNPNYIDAPFLSHHDALGRIASHTGSYDETRQAAEILLTLQGNPIIYYGDEVEMKGLGESRNNMNWGDYYTGLNIASVDYGTPGVDEQLLDSNSLLNTYKQLLNVRNHSLALQYGDFSPYQSSYLEGYIRVFENGNDKEVVVVLFNFTNTFFIPVPSEFTSYEILYRTNSTNYGGLSPNSTMIIRLPWDVYQSLN